MIPFIKMRKPPTRVNALILSGGVAHPYGATSKQLVGILSEADINSEVTEDLDMLASPRMEEFGLLILNCVRWTCDQTPQWRDDWRYLMPEENRVGLIKHLESGRGLLALHAATICFDDWPEFRRILGGWWEWGHSGHAPYDQHRMLVHRDSHPIVDGVPDFDIIDELYTDPRVTDPIAPAITAVWESREHPILWTRKYGRGRVCYCALGHEIESFENRWFRLIIQRSSLWAVGRYPKPSHGM
jgi:type 1 glutamine amidotransferase